MMKTVFQVFLVFFLYGAKSRLNWLQYQNNKLCLLTQFSAMVLIFMSDPEQSVAHMQSFICRIGEIREIGETGYSLIYHAAFSATGRHMTASNHCEWFVS